MIWLALLTVYQSYVTTDALSVLKSVEANQEHTLKYMQKSASILKRIRKAADKEHFTVAHDDSPARS
jgi:predicted transposase YbfD/YdcC